MKTNRIIINSSDIAALYGCSVRTGLRKIKKVKDVLNKPDDITIKEYCLFYKLPFEEVIGSLHD